SEVNETLYKQGLLSEIIWRTSKVKAEELATRNEIEEKRASIISDEVKAQLAAQEAQLSQRRALYQLRKSQVEQLKVRAGIKGVLQVTQVQVGQQVTAGGETGPRPDPAPPEAGTPVRRTPRKG